MIRRFNMFPYKTFGGQVVSEDLEDGRVRYTLFPFPADGDDSRTLIIDPKNVADQRAISQLHLVAVQEGSPDRHAA